MKTIIMIIVLLSSITIFAKEIQLNNKHFKDYNNPFKEILKDKKHGDINIQVKNEILKIKVETNRDLGGYMNYNNTSYELNKDIIKNTVSNILQYQYNLVSTGSNVLVDIKNINIYVDYLEKDNQSMLSVHDLVSYIEVSIDYVISVEGKEIYKKTFKRTTREPEYFNRYVGVLTPEDLSPESRDVQEVIGNYIEKTIYVALYEAKDNIQLNIKK